jgi:serpin B
MPATDSEKLVQGNNTFAVELYSHLRNQSGNLFFSPASVSTALAMTYAGARGDTATQMANTLHYNLPPAQLHPAMGALLNSFNAAHDGYQLHVANALWAQQGYSFLDAFLKLNKSNYGAGFHRVDFKGAAEATRQTINQWTEQQTENKIKDLLRPGVLKPDTRLVLTNAIYFKSAWQTTFKKSQTENENFYLSDQHKNVTAPLMHRTGRFNYYSGDTFQVLEIPYKNEELSLIVFLPNNHNGLADFERLLTASNMQQWLGQLSPVPEVEVTIPKFKLAEQIDLAGTLSSMGMPLAFDNHAADFPAITGKPELFISAVIHKAFIDVNEDGTEAAAATAAVFGMLAVAPRPHEQPIVFRADHPFLYLIRDNHSGSILFMGRVTDPTK